MLLVKQLYGRNADGAHHNVDVGKDVGKDDMFLSKESSKGTIIRRNAILDLIRGNPAITIPEIAIIQQVIQSYRLCQ